MNSEILANVIIVVALILELSAIIVFLFRYKYATKAGLDLLGIGLTITFIFPILGTLSAKIMHQDISQATILAENITLFFDFSLIVITYHRQLIVKQEFVLIVWVIFLFIWLAELLPQPAMSMERLPKTNVFISVTMVVGILVYWLSVFQKASFYYLRNPFFWVTIGWFIYYFLDSTTYLDFKALSSVKRVVLFGEKAVIWIIFDIFYIIAFWKSKDWVQKGFGIK
jgi:hypothetical protein